eukprot:694107-Prymnesium_polylepis.1
MVRREVVSGATRALRCRVWPMAYGLRCAVWRQRALRAPRGAVAGTRYVSMRGLTGSRRVPPT